MTHRHRPLPLVALLATVWGFAHAQPLPAPLVEATKTAVLASPDVQERWKALRGKEAQVQASRAGWRPRVDLSANAGRESLRTGAQDFGTFNVSGTQLSLTQLLFDGGITSSDIRASGHEWRKSYHELNAASEYVALEVVKAYLDLLRHQELIAAATQNYAEHKATLDMLNERVRAAVARRVDLEQATARLAQAEATLTNLQIGHHKAAARYLRMVGTTPSVQLPAWPESQAFSPVPPTSEAALQQGIRGNPSLLASVDNLLTTEQVLAGRQAAYLPQLQARAVLSEARNQDGITGRSERHYAEVVLSQNIYRGGADQAYETRASELSLRARAQVEQTCREVQQDLSVAHKDVDTYSTQAKLADQHRLAADKTKTAYRQQFDIGQRTLLDLLDTQSEFFEAQSDYTNARFNHLTAQARTLAGMGRLVETMTAIHPPAPETDTDLAAADPSVYCSPQVTPMDSLERIKASLDIPRRQPKVSVVLLPNPDGTVGRIILSGKDGEQEIATANHGAPLTGAQPGAAVSAADIESKFGDALKAQPPLPEKFTLFFQRGQTRLTPASEAEWPQVLERLRDRKTLDITVAGHTDTVSSEKLNEKLALKRAQAIEKRLRQSGFKDVVMSVESYGARSLMVPTPPQTDEQKNRRVVINAR